MGRTYYRAQDTARASGVRTARRPDDREHDARGDPPREGIHLSSPISTSRPRTCTRTPSSRRSRAGKIKKLVIAVPSGTDQPFGDIVRNEFITDLRDADGGRGIVHVGYPRRRFTVSDNDLRSSSGKCLLGEPLPPTPGIDPTVVLKPASRVPKVPFWLAVEGELMWVYDEAAGAPAGAKRLKVVRGAETKFVKGGSAPEGPTTREHQSGGRHGGRFLGDLRPREAAPGGRRFCRRRIGQREPPRVLPRWRDSPVHDAAVAARNAEQPDRELAAAALGGPARHAIHAGRSATGRPRGRGEPVGAIAVLRQPLHRRRSGPQPHPVRGNDRRRR